MRKQGETWLTWVNVREQGETWVACANCEKTERIVDNLGQIWEHRAKHGLLGVNGDTHVCQVTICKLEVRDAWWI